MKGILPKWLIPAVLAAVLILGATQAHATSLAPGATVTPGTTGLGTGAMLVGTETVSFTTTSGATGTLTEMVYSGDSNNPSGGLDFVYQVAGNSGSSASITSLSGLSFSGFSTDVTQTGLGNVTVPATTASRSPGVGQTVTWNFAGGIPAGGLSDTLIVRTDANNFNSGSIVITDSAGGAAAVGGFAPTPEPSSLVLLGSCLAGLGVGAWRRRKVA